MISNDSNEIINDLIFQLFVVWKKLSLDQLKVILKMDFLELLHFLNKSITKGYIFPDGNSEFILNKNNYEVIEKTKKIILNRVQKRIDEINDKLGEGDLNKSLEDYKILIMNWNPILSKELKIPFTILKNNIFNQIKNN